MDKPALPKGTRDFGPLAMSRRQYIMDVIRDVFQRFGFAPLETPAMESLSVLMGKYGDEGDQLLFKVLNSGDFLKDVDPTLLNTRNARALAPVIAEKGLRYDLTVPFARYVIMNRHEMTLPFKRYQMQPVWRADRPQKGRYREFYQCDADVVGTNSLLCEMEIILMVKSVFRQLGIEPYTIRINHRDVMTGVASLVDAGNATGTLFTAIDKLDKIGVEGVRRELAGNGWSDRQLDRLFEILATTGTNVDKLDHLDSLSTDAGKKGIADLREILALLLAYGDSDEHVEVDLSLARGLSYYTGTIFEVRVDGVSVGSVSGGGRYDNLTQAFGSKEQLPGVGISFGLDRLYDVLDELARFPESPGMSTRVLICHIDAASLRYGLKVLSALRNAGIGAEIYPDEARLKKQLDYANKRSIPHAIVIGPDEIASRLLVFRDMALGSQEKKPLEAILEQLKA